MGNSKTIVNICKFIGFLVVLGLVFIVIQNPFIRDEDQKRFQHIKGFYHEEANRLDFLYVGASNVYPWYEPPIAWNDYGIRSYDLSVPGMPARAVKYVVEEALKTQPDALYVFNLNNFKNKTIGYVRIHNIADYMHFSKTKINMINDLAEHSDIPAKDRLEFYFPLLRVHSGWSELVTTDFVKELNHLKGGDDYYYFFNLSNDQSKNVAYSKKRVTPVSYRKENLVELVEYLKERKVKALFVSLPQAVKRTNYVGQLNEMSDYVRSEGFDVLNLLDEESDFEKIGLDYKYDFQDSRHTNVHGAIKYTRFFAKYMQDRYGFADKRKEKGNEAWDEAVKRYFKILEPHTLDFEREISRRTLDLKRPDEIRLKVEGTTMNVSWDPVEGADKYVVYRRKLLLRKDEITTRWKRIAEVDKDITSFTDNDLRKHKTYYYTVVPVVYEDGEPVYGCFDYKGASKKTEG